MIHSMSGGVLSDGGLFTFVKVEVRGTPAWYLSPLALVKAGDRVLVPDGSGEAEGVIVKVERGDRQVAPVPLSRMREITKVLL